VDRDGDRKRARTRGKLRLLIVVDDLACTKATVVAAWARHGCAACYAYGGLAVGWAAQGRRGVATERSTRAA
jgi:hypothetical protein